MRVRVTFSLQLVAAAFLLTSCADDGAPPLRDKSDDTEGTGGDTEGSGCNPSSPESLATCVEASGYEADLRFIADIRDPGSTHWQAVQDLCFDRLTELGYQVEQHEYITGVNIIGRKPGVTAPQEEVVIAAHYDHLNDCLGADDNASGVAGALEAARVMAQAEFDRTITIACWDQEEVGLVGSRAFVQEATMRGDQFVANYNFEMIGYKTEEPDTQAFPAGFDLLFADAYAQVQQEQFKGNFIALIADDFARVQTDSMLAHAEATGLRAIRIEVDQSQKNSALLGDLRRSDHASFWDVDVGGIMITDTANFRNLNYHCAEGEDSVDRLDSTFSAQVIATTVAAAAQTAGLR